MKRDCRYCGIAKPATDYYTGERACKPCKNQRAQMHKKLRKATNPTRYTAQQSTYNRRNALKRYGMTIEQFEALKQLQDHKCAICGGTQQSIGFMRRVGPKELCVDHNHTTQQNRGLLCTYCNAAIGLLQDDPTVAERAVAYLKSWQA